MQNRMDKYSVNPKSIGSRTEKNKNLYENVRNSSMKNYEIKSNVSIIDNDANNINVGKVRKMIDERYSDSSPKRRSIEIPEFTSAESEEKVQDTKEYDINAILAKAKVGKNVDYNKERLKKVRDTQYEILNNLDLELKKEELETKSKSQEDAENNLMNLINTITELEIKNRNKETSDASDLLDLTDDTGDVTEPNRQLEETSPSPIEKIEEVDEDEEESCNEVRLVRKTDKKENANKEKVDKEETLDEIREYQTEEFVEESEEETEEELENDKEEPTEEIASSESDKETEKKRHIEKNDEHIERTLSKLDINMSSYEDFADISKRDNGSLVIKIVIFIIIIVLVLGAIYILNDILNLGLF